MRTFLPSKAADSVWHAWIKHDLESYSNYCRKWFKREISHQPVSKDTTQRQKQDGIVTTFVLNCLLNGIDFAIGELPSLFILDRKLQMPFGK
jgi:hypothetical protein